MYCYMILEQKTEHLSTLKFSEIKKFSKFPIVVECDYCGVEFETTFIKYYSCKKNNINQKDCCSSKNCISLKKKETFMIKYGVDNPKKLKCFKEKAEETNIKKYGHRVPLHNEELKNKSKKTCLTRYGVENPFQSQELKNKSKKTCLAKYGVEFPSQSDEVKQSVKETCLIKYGYTSPLQNPDIKSQLLNTHIKKYGGMGMGSDETRDKIENTNLQRYGHRSFVKSPMFKKTIQKTNLHNLYQKLSTTRLGDHIVPDFIEDEYMGVDHEYPFLCKTCDTKFTDNLDDGHVPLCPKCNLRVNCRSLIENEVYDFLIHNISGMVERNRRKVLNNQFELDFYIPDKNIAIELNGNYYHSELAGGKNRKYHLDKTNLCEEKGIQLIHIFEDEWILKQNLIKQILLSKLTNQKKIFARKCDIRYISFKEKKLFLEAHHLQGNDISQYYIGAFYQEELISVMTFSKCRFTKNNEIEMTRFCSSKPNIGLAGKMMSFFIKTQQVNKIISYCNRRYSVGNLYEQLGFVQICKTAPCYYYMDTKQYLVRHHRFSYRKSVLSKKLPIFDSKLTEWENMQLNGYDRIWDSGHLKYELTV
jgi:hypothetical protein